MVRILHTSDWHLGRILENSSLAEHQAQFLQWLAELCQERQVDAILADLPTAFYISAVEIEGSQLVGQFQVEGEQTEEFGLVVERVITVIDRLAGAQAAFAARGIPLESLVTIRDLGIDPDAK